ncbi:hypothetical protein EXIGLDRAFT_836242 [Exidia glandulosa HHB12029]|uniref:Uncharacterized protein n=1 Tax=Exidia glandulosa HHB12029 TaxID=1314781 RepID=A0A165I0K4_EXIGL|nr:hypothetical protein EXIGLDRAFT_836242 [Exidia glandulosa HHB12029]
MAPTRRKSKRTASSAAVAEPDDAGSQDATEDAGPSSQPSRAIDLPEDLPIDALAALLPDISLESPSPDAIVSLYRLVAAQVAELESSSNELEEARAQALRKEVELDSAIQDRESTVRELETSLESVTAELSAAKQERDALQSSNSAMQAQLSNMSSSQSASSGEVDTLRRRVEDAESEKRSLMGVMDRMKEQDALRDDEVKTMRDRLREAREEITELQSKLSEVTASDNANKFKIHTIEQELVLANGEREQLRTDLSARIEERAKYRREKETQVRELQAALDSASSEATSFKNALETLQAAHDNQTRSLQTTLAQVGELKGELAAKDASFRAELGNTKRMVAMLERRQEEAQKRVEEVDREWNEMTSRAAQQEDKLRREVDRERARGDDLEKQLEELRVVMNKMGSGELPLPEANGNGNGFALSPTASLASKLQKSGRSYTEVYTDYVRLQDELARQKQETKRLEDCLAQILADIEERAPLLQEQRHEYERVSAEARQLADQLSAALEDRDAYAQRAQASEQKNAVAQRERELLDQQLSDLGRQVQNLIREQQLRDNPGLALADLDEPQAGATDTDNLISQQLVLFRSIPELQQQNQLLLASTRELAARLEQQEAEQRARDEDEDSAMLREAEALVAEAHRELEEVRKSAKVKIEAYTREVEMLKGMLAKASGERRALPSMPGEGSASMVLGSHGEYQSMYHDAQRAFDAYKLEIGEDNRRLKDDLLHAQREVGTVNAALAKANAKITTLEERVRLAGEEKQAHLRAISELTKAKETLQVNLARVENSYSEIVEKHTVATGTIDTLRNQTVQLKAEREVLKGVEARLTVENKNLSSQRTHLTDLMQNLRKMQADLEKSEENDKRRLEARAQNLEMQVEELRQQLNKERDLLRHAQFQKDAELRTLRERLDRASQDLSSTREQLVAAQTSQTHLQERVDDLSKQLQGSQERLSVYERRPSAVNGAIGSMTGLSQEQQLEAEVAELRGQLKIAEVDLETARANVEQFREISSASEAALEQVSNTYEQYKAQTEKELADRTATVNSLEQKLAELQESLSVSATRATELQTTLEKERAAFAEDKRTLEDTILEVTNSNSMSSTDREAHANELRQQQERAQLAEEQYQRELVAHADAIKVLERTREQLLQAQAASREHQTQAETAQAKLLTSETSWSVQREMLDKQIAELTAKQQALNEQNNVLHQHLETVSSQAARIRQAADASITDTDPSAVSADPALNELRSVISYLRKEKEIADLQLEINQQEIARLKADSERMARELDEQKALLAEERERATNTLASAQQQAELVERINQLNILRESNATLRSDSQALRKRVTQLETQVQSLASELEPVKNEARDAKAELESRMQQIAQLERENSKWKERNQQILKKYDRTDPEELQRMKEELEAVVAQKEAVEAQRVEIENRANTYRTNLAAFKERYEALTQQTRQNFTKLNSEIATHKEQVKTLEAERDALQKKLADAQAAPVANPVSTLEISNLQARIKAVVAEKAQLEATFAAEKKALEERLAAQPAAPTNESDVDIAALRAERDALLSEKVTWTIASAAAGTGTDDEKAAKLAELQAAQEHATKELAAKNASLERTSAALQSQLEALKAEKASLEEQLKTAGATAEPASAELESLRAKVAELEKRLAEQPPAGAEGGAGQAAIDAAVAAAEEKFKASHQTALQTAAENAKAEVAMKLKLQETRISRVNARIVQLCEKLTEAGIAIPDPPEKTAATRPTPAAASTSKAPANAAAKAPGTNGAPAAATALPGGRKPNLPPVPASAGLPAPPTAAVTASPAAGRGRGAPRGGRGRGGAPRGGGPALAAAVAAAAASTPSTPTGAGATAAVAGAKRGREDDGGGDDTSLAKRLRPGGPVPIDRSRVLPGDGK